MSIKATATKGIIHKPQLILVHSQPGAGKTTWASEFPSTLIIDLEGGANHVNCDKLGADKCPDIKSLNQIIDSLLENQEGYKTLVVDSAVKLESYIHTKLCEDGKVKSIEDYGGGFGKGYTAARELLIAFMAKLKRLSEKMDVIICAHSQIKTFQDPAAGMPYDRWVIQTNDKFAQILTSQADNVFFLKHNVITTKDRGASKARGFSDGSRKLMTEWNAAFEAKNRLGLTGEIDIDMGSGYKAFKSAVENAKPKPVADIKADIESLLTKVAPEIVTRVSKAITDAGEDAVKLQQIKNKLTEIVTNQGG
jgi:hypothetical protein